MCFSILPTVANFTLHNEQARAFAGMFRMTLTNLVFTRYHCLHLCFACRVT